MPASVRQAQMDSVNRCCSLSRSGPILFAIANIIKDPDSVYNNDINQASNDLLKSSGSITDYFLFLYDFQ